MYLHSCLFNFLCASFTDSPESARREILIFFPDFDFHKWSVEEEPFFVAGKVVFDEDRFIHHALKS